VRQVLGGARSRLAVWLAGAMSDEPSDKLRLTVDIVAGAGLSLSTAPTELGAQQSSQLLWDLQTRSAPQFHACFVTVRDLVRDQEKQSLCIATTEAANYSACSVLRGTADDADGFCFNSLALVIDCAC
jgi:hypothetical protein